MRRFLVAIKKDGETIDTFLVYASGIDGGRDAIDKHMAKHKSIVWDGGRGACAEFCEIDPSKILRATKSKRG